MRRYLCSLAKITQRSEQFHGPRCNLANFPKNHANLEQAYLLQFFYCLTYRSGGPMKGVKCLCIPFTQPQSIEPTDICIRPDCTNKPTMFSLYGRSY